MPTNDRSLPNPQRILISAGAHAELTALLRSRRSDLEIRGKPYTEITADDLEWADTYVGFKRPPLATMGSVRWVHCTGAGVDSWLQPTELPRHILLTRTSESFGVYIAEWALARALAVRQQIVDLADEQRRHEWSPREIGYVRGSRAVVVGTGGRRLAHREVVLRVGRDRSRRVAIGAGAGPVDLRDHVAHLGAHSLAATPTG
jgi:phosphoglycerate dehydrogenase-like enzyme